MKILSIYGSGEENCKQSLIHLLLDRLERFSLIEVVDTDLYSSVISEPEGSWTGPYADSKAFLLIKVHASENERTECIEQGIQLAGGSEGLIILGDGVKNYAGVDYKIAVQDEGDNTLPSDADFIYRLREELDDLVVEINRINSMLFTKRSTRSQ